MSGKSYFVRAVNVPWNTQYDSDAQFSLSYDTYSFSLRVEAQCVHYHPQITLGKSEDEQTANSTDWYTKELGSGTHLVIALTFSDCIAFRTSFWEDNPLITTVGPSDKTPEEHCHNGFARFVTPSPLLESRRPEVVEGPPNSYLITSGDMHVEIVALGWEWHVLDTLGRPLGSRTKYKLMWRGEHVGNVVRTRSDMGEHYGGFTLVTQDPEIISFLRIVGARDVTSGDDPFTQFEQAFTDSMYLGWTLVDTNGTVTLLYPFPLVAIDDGVICWSEGGPESFEMDV